MTMMFNLSASMKTQPPPHEISPPWDVYPDLAPGDYGWRCGPGAHYLSEWSEWFFGLEPATRTAYLLRHDAPVDWVVCTH